MTAAVLDTLWDDLLAVFGDRPLRVLTVHQPHASLIAAAATVLNGKTTENRGYRIKPGPLVIHAGKNLDAEALRMPLARRVLIEAGMHPEDLPSGALVAVVNVTGSHRADRGCCPLWGQPDQVHNQLTVIRAFPEPVPMRGRQGIWYLAPPAPAVSVDTVAAAIRAHRYHYAHEDGLQAGITEALTAAGLPAVREVRLAPSDRVDVLAGGVGIEVKVAGSPESVLAQLQRYATHDRITALVLVTTRSRHRAMPPEVGGKPLSVIYLGGVT